MIANGSERNAIENIWGVMSRKMNVDPTWNTDEIWMNVLCAWEYYMDKSEYLQKMSRSAHDRLMSVLGMDGH